LTAIFDRDLERPMSTSSTSSSTSSATPGATSSSAAADRPAESVDPKLLEILVCPLTKSPLEYDAAKQELISRAAKLAYPIRDGIPIMLPEEARRID
jgi:uncharacterized protein